MKSTLDITPPEGSWKRIIGISALALVLGLATGCGGGSNDDPVDLPNPPIEPEPEPDFLGTAPGDADDYTHIEMYFDQITPENAGKWESVEAERDMMTWTNLDTAYDFAKANDIAFKFHVLVWGQQQPGWLEGLTPEEQLAEVDEWMAAVAERYPDLTMVEVVNEPLHAPAGYKEALGGDGETGWDWVIKSFEMARSHFPDAKLMINDYQILHLDQFVQNYLEVIKPLIERDLVDGIGVQAHFLERMDTATVKANLDLLATETGLPIYVSEFDLDLPNDARHANQFKNMFTIFWEHPAVAGVTLWGHREGSVWQEGGYLINADGTEREAMVWLQCYLADRTDCTVPEYVPTGWQGDEYGVTLEAELFDEGEGILALGSAVSYVDGGDWIAFKNVDIQDAYDTFWLTYARKSELTSSVSVHLGSLDSAAEFELDLPDTGSWGTNETLEHPLDLTAGTYDIFLKFNGTVEVGNVDYVRIGQPLPESTVNVLPNGGFEAGINGWSTWYGATLEVATAADKVHSGAQSLLITNRVIDVANDGEGKDNAAYTLTDLVSAATTYTVSAWVQHTGATADTIRLGGVVECSDPPVGHNSYPWIVNQTDIPPNTWTQISGTLIIPDCNVTNVVINVEGTSEGVDVYVDDVVVSPPGENLVTNGGFEAGIAGWTNGGWTTSSFEQSTAVAHDGSTYSLRVHTRDSADDNAVYTLTGLVNSNTTYTARAWIYVDDATVAETPVKFTAKYDCVDADASYVTVDSYADDSATPEAEPLMPTGEWVELSGDFTIPAACELEGSSLLFVESVAANVDFYLDDVSVLAK